MKRRALLLGNMLAASLAMTACSPSAAPRPQLLVVIDTDLPVVDQLQVDSGLSDDAAVDSIHIDAFDASGQPFDFFDGTVPDPLDWPVSFGVEMGRATSLRVRVFRAQNATPATILGRGTLLPPPALAVDRIIAVPASESGVVTLEAVLTGDCLGVVPSFATTPPTSCVDAAHPSAPATDGTTVLASGAAPPTRAGTWPPARESNCPGDGGPGPRGSVCVPGGFTLLGDSSLVGVADGIASQFDPVPLTPVILSPFYLDVKEVTVGDFDALRAAQPGAITGPLPLLPSTQARCTWLGGMKGNDQLPLNCLPHQTAAEICVALGGKLPSEAQWEHEARGRGQHRRYPWGDVDPTCCTASLGQGMGCVFTGIAPVGTHAVGSACGGVVDVSRDGIFDMGGSVSEMTLDASVAYGTACWAAPTVLHDPVCDSGSTSFIRRGGSWSTGFSFALAVLRFTALAEAAYAENTVGFRCAYPAGGT